MSAAEVAAIDLSACDREPIHIPGSIQPHGILLVVAEPSFVVTDVSANIEAMLGITAAAMCGARLSTILGAAECERFERTVRESKPAEINPMHFVLHAQGVGCEFECVVHRWNGLLIAEFEPYESPTGQTAMDLLSNVRNPITRMAAAFDIATLSHVAAIDLQAISGFDRVMIYRFDEDWHGEVLAEVTAGGVPVSYLGLHFPADDIPEQARRLYLKNPIRLIPDVRYAPAPLTGAHDGAATAPIDLSRALLRSVSPVHLEYLQNMDVTATMTISIIVGRRLWGLVACHHRTPRRIDYGTRAVCELLGEILAWRIGLQLETETLATEVRGSALIASFVTALGAQLELGNGLAAAAHDLLELFDAQGLVVKLANSVTRIGVTPANDAVIGKIAAELARNAHNGAAASHRVDSIVPAAEHCADTASGALLIALSDVGDEYLLFLRAEVLREVNWGGDIRSRVTEYGGRLHPRGSFELWKERVSGQSAHWSAYDLKAAQTVRQEVLERYQAIERLRAEARIRFLAHYDVLTQLPNRASFHEILQKLILDSKRDRRSFALLFVDIDRFKLFNDEFGHAFGDRILQAAASRMRGCVRHDDVVARLGGDEFVITLHNIGAPIDADMVAGKLVAAISEALVIDKAPEIRFTASVGIAVYPQDGLDGEALLQHADLAMYRAKELGRNTFAHFTTDQAGPTYERLTLEWRIEEGLKRNEFVPYYQPIVDARTGRLVAMEALARWVHPQEGVLPPARFIALAEESRLILILGKAMLRAACTDCAAWVRVLGAQPFHVSVNVSGRQFREPGFFETVLAELKEAGLDPVRLQLELTESLLIGDEAYTTRTLEALARAGVGMAIDDFGTGYSSLSYLKRIPVEALKIDQSFIRDLSNRSDDNTIVRAVIALAHSLKLSVVAEGVETKDQLAFLRSEDCDSIQGYLIAKPLSYADATEFVMRNHEQHPAGAIASAVAPCCP